MGALDDFIAKLFAEQTRKLARAVAPWLDLLATDAVCVENIAVNATTSQPQNVTFPCDGYVVAVTASVQSGSAGDTAATKLRIDVDGNAPSFVSASGTSALAAGFVSFAHITGQTGAAFRWYRKSFLQATPWSIYVKSTANIVADVTFWIVNISKPRP